MNLDKYYGDILDQMYNGKVDWREQLSEEYVEEELESLSDSALSRLGIGSGEWVEPVDPEPINRDNPRTFRWNTRGEPFNAAGEVPLSDPRISYFGLNDDSLEISRGQIESSTSLEDQAVEEIRNQIDEEIITNLSNTTITTDSTITGINSIDTLSGGPFVFNEIENRISLLEGTTGRLDTDILGIFNSLYGTSYNSQMGMGYDPINDELREVSRISNYNLSSITQLESKIAELEEKLELLNDKTNRIGLK